MSAGKTKISFNAERDTFLAHENEALGDVLHIAHAGWHGIRNATGALPGLKLMIPHDEHLDGEAIRHVYGIIFKYRIRKICFQGYSGPAHALAVDVKRRLGREIDLYVVTHVTSSQFENPFEMQMQELVHKGLSSRVFTGVGSVKPGFSSIMSGYWPKTVINFAPNVGDRYRGIEHDAAAVLVPLENTWRKNLYTNLIGALSVPSVDAVYTVNWPTGLDSIVDLGKVRQIAFRTGQSFLDLAASVGSLLNVTLAECQPMTQLEAAAVGTPCLTGPLGIEELGGHEFTRLCEVTNADNPREITRALHQALAEMTADPAGVTQMIDDWLDQRHRLAAARYLEFLGL